MGNANSNTTNTTKTETPSNRVSRTMPVFNPVYGYNYQPETYLPQPYPYVIDPASYPLVPSEYYFPNGFVPLPQEIYTVLEQPMYNQPYQQDQQLPQSMPHDYPHYLQQYPHYIPPFEEKPLASPAAQKPNISHRQPPGSFPPQSSFQPQKPVSSIVTFKVPAPPVANNEVITVPPPANNEVMTVPPPSLPVHHSPPVVIQQSPVSIVTEKRTSSISITDLQSSPLVIREIASPTSLATSSKNEKIQIIRKSYRAQSPGSHSIHQYVPSSTSETRRNSSKITPSANRWYDHGYDKQVQPFAVADA